MRSPLFLGVAAVITSTTGDAGATPTVMVPSFGTPVVMANTNITANSDPHVSTTPIVLSAGESVIIGATTRNNGNPGSDFLDATLTPSVGDPVVMTLVSKAKLNGAGRQIIALYYASPPAGTYDLSIDMDGGANRDLVMIGIPVEDMKPTGDPFGTSPAAESFNTSDDEVLQAVTPVDPLGVLLSFVAVGVGNAALDYTGIGGTRVSQASTGGAGSGADISAAMITGDSTNTSVRDVGASFSAADDDRAIVCVELVSWEA